MFRLKFELQGGSLSPVLSHARTWGRLEIVLGETSATHVEDREAKSVRDGIYLPLLPLAQWFLANWWFLFEEAPPQAAELGARATAVHRPWFERHNLLFAREGFPLPDLTIARSDDALLLVAVEPDPSRPSVFPVRFLDRWLGFIPRDDVERQVRSFIQAIVNRVDDLETEDAKDLVEAWTAMGSLTSDDRLLRQRSAALGLDGDDPEIVDDALADQLVNKLTDLPPGLVMDMLESSGKPKQEVPARAETVRRARALRRNGGGGQLSAARAAVRPIADDDAKYRVGWRMAQSFRKHFAIASAAVGHVLDEAIERTEIVTQANHTIPFGDEGIRGWVGADAEHKATVVLAGAARPQSSRFLRARAVALALLGGRERLITSSSTRAQSISRAFATELLAPIEAIRDRISGSYVSEDQISDIASSLQVDPKVVVHQIENHQAASVAE